jgi:thiamine-phosphate pyrophosphorylase
MNNFGLYLVMTNPVVGYQACCEAAVRAGVKMVQLRMKDSPRNEIVQTAKDLVSITKGSETKLIVNDDPSIAAESGADGVHVGQDDISVIEVRQRFPEIPIVGLSTHNLSQAIAAEALNPDYIGVGPVYPTPTKKIPDPVLGIERAMEMIKSVSMPAVAIGGLNLKTLPAVIKAGAQNWAIVRAVCESSSPYDAIRAVQEIAQ